MLEIDRIFYEFKTNIVIIGEGKGILQDLILMIKKKLCSESYKSNLGNVPVYFIL